MQPPFTKNMLEDLYLSSVETYVHFKNGYYDTAMGMLQKMLRNHSLTSAMEIDLLNRLIIAQTSKTEDPILSALFVHTQNKDILLQYTKVKSFITVDIAY